MFLNSAICVRCKKSFDFDLYSGLCPHCGCFHRAIGQSNNIKTIVRPEAGTLADKYQKHIEHDRKTGNLNHEHKTSANVKTTTSSQIKKTAKSKKSNSAVLLIVIIIIAIFTWFPALLAIIFGFLF